MKEGGTSLHKTIRGINLVYKGLSVSSSIQPVLSVLQHTYEPSQPMNEEDANASAACGGTQGIGKSLSHLGLGLGGSSANKSADIGAVLEHRKILW